MHSSPISRSRISFSQISHSPQKVNVMSKTTVRTGSNIAFIKYWGVADAEINLPLNSSISMTLADAHTTTTLEWDRAGALAADQICLDGVRLGEKAAGRLVRHLDRIRRLAGIEWRARVESVNNFPMASGIASSASGFCALTVAACTALGPEFGINLSPTRLSAISRLGSGSASRSHFGGFVEWEQGTDDVDSVAVPLFPADHWDLYDIVVVVSSAEKKVSSENGHTIALTSPLLDGRIRGLSAQLDTVRQAIADRDLAALGPVIEQDALAMHAVMMTSTPSLLYWQPGTLELLHAVRRWRESEGIPVYFTIDAGPNVHLMCESKNVAAVETRLSTLPSVQRVIVSRPGPGPQLMDQHLF